MSYRNDSFPQEFFFHDRFNDPERGLCCSSPCCCSDDGWHDDRRDDRRFFQRVVVSSATGSAGPLAATAALVTPINVVSTNVNTCRLGTTDNLVSFSGIITIPAVTAVTTTTLVFQVLRSSCIGSAITVGSAYTFSVSTAALTSQSFSFSFTDSNVAPGTYTYSVQLATGSVVGVAGTTILNATLNVTATRK